MRRQRNLLKVDGYFALVNAVENVILAKRTILRILLIYQPAKRFDQHVAVNNRRGRVGGRVQPVQDLQG